MRGGRRPPTGPLQAQAQWGAVRPSGADKPTLVILSPNQAPAWLSECFDLFAHKDTERRKALV